MSLKAAIQNSWSLCEHKANIQSTKISTSVSHSMIAAQDFDKVLGILFRIYSQILSVKHMLKLLKYLKRHCCCFCTIATMRLFLGGQCVSTHRFDGGSYDFLSWQNSIFETIQQFVAVLAVTQGAHHVF